MKPTEIRHHAQTVLEIGEGVIDLNSTAWDFADDYAAFLYELLERAQAELTRIDSMRAGIQNQEARAEPEYRY